MGESEQDYQACRIKVALLKQEVDNFKGFFDRLDVAIEKIGIVSGDIKQMLAVHEEKIAVMDEKINTQRENSLMAQESFRDEIKELHSRITTVTREVSANLITSETKILAGQTSLETKIMAGHDDLKRYFMQSHASLEKRVKILENWRYVLVGIFLVVGVAVGFVINNRINITALSP